MLIWSASSEFSLDKIRHVPSCSVYSITYPIDSVHELVTRPEESFWPLFNPQLRPHYGW